jgi:hypothetical protein
MSGVIDTSYDKFHCPVASEKLIASLAFWKTVVPDTRYRLYIQLRAVYRKIRYLLGIPKIEPVPPVYLKDIKDQEEIKNRIWKWLDLLYVSPKG